MRPRLAWTRPRCDTLLMLITQGATVRKAAAQLGVSKTAISRQYLRLVSESQDGDRAARLAQGAEPLRPGHPTTWAAISSTTYARRA